MAFQDRLRERRELLKMSREDLAEKLNITTSAIGNYENGVSSPKPAILFKIFKALNCDANYLFQDEMNELANKSKPSSEATEVAHAYDNAEIDKQNIVRLTLGLDLKKDTKITRIHEPRPDKYSMAAETPAEYPDHLKLNAARPLKGATGEYKQHDEDIMDDPNF